MPFCFRRLGFLRPGEYFGEYSCLLGQERSATVVASTYLELYSLSRADLEAVLQQWPELAEQFEAMGETAFLRAAPGCAHIAWHQQLASAVPEPCCPACWRLSPACNSCDNGCQPT